MKRNFQSKQFGNIKPSNDFRIQAKKRLLERISQDQASWLENLMHKFQKAQSTPLFKTQAKARLFARINTPAPLLPDWLRLFLKQFLHQRTLALGTVVSILFVSFFSTGLSPSQTAKASQEVTLLILEGTPLIKHLGEDWEKAQQMQILHIGDKVKTPYNGLTEIHFFNNSITRLSANTEITIVAFQKDQATELVSLELNKGKAWNKALQTPALTSNFTIKTHNSIVSTQNATFDIAEEGDQNQPTKINVVERLIDIKILQSNSGAVVSNTKVTGGYSVEVGISGTKTQASAAQITPLKPEDKDAPWFRENLAKDKAHLQKREAEKEAQIIAEAGILPGSPFYPVKKTIQEAKEIISTSENQTAIADLKKDFQEAVALLARGDQTQGTAMLATFQNNFQKISLQTNLKTKLETFLLNSENDLSTILPDSKLYIAKKTLRELHLSIAPDPTKLIHEQKKEKLFEAQDLLEKKEFQLAQNLLAELNHNESLNLNPKNTKGLPTETEKQKLLYKTEELQILQSLKEEIPENPATVKLIPLVDKIHQETVQELTAFAPPAPEARPTPTQKTTKPQIQVMSKEEEIQAKADNFLDRVHVYSSATGQLNQITLLLRRMPDKQEEIPVLVKIRQELPLEYQHLVTRKILKITHK